MLGPLARVAAREHSRHYSASFRVPGFMFVIRGGDEGTDLFSENEVLDYSRGKGNGILFHFHFMINVRHTKVLTFALDRHFSAFSLLFVLSQEYVLQAPSPLVPSVHPVSQLCDKVLRSEVQHSCTSSSDCVPSLKHLSSIERSVYRVFGITRSRYRFSLQ